MNTLHNIAARLLALILVLITIVPAGLTALAANVDAEGYTIIKTAAELDAVRDNPGGKFRLYADIDLNGYTSKTNTATKGWYPIGYGKWFTGTFDGNGYSISGLWSSKDWAIGYTGLFSVLEGATVKNLTINLDKRGITGVYNVGGLAGDAKKGTTVDNVTVNGGRVVTWGGGYAGGLIGFVRDSKQNVITYCTVNGTYTETSGNYSGGMFGVVEAGSIVRYCEAIDTISAGYSYVGGFVGAVKSKSIIECSNTNGTATGKGSYVGGFMGVSYEQSTINNCLAEGKVVAAGSYAGGFAGAVYGASNVKRAFAYGDVTAKYYAGGLIGTIYDKSILEQSCAYGNVNLTGGYIAGGLIGESFGSTISNTYARGNVSGGTGAATGVGGLVGYFSLVGTNTITNSYSSGSVSGKGTKELGGFSGFTAVTFMGTNYYDSDTAGVAQAYGTAGAVKGQASAYPQGKSTAAMMKKATFSGWDFSNIWRIDENTSYPYFDPWVCPHRQKATVTVTERQPMYAIKYSELGGNIVIPFDVKIDPANLTGTPFVTLAAFDGSDLGDVTKQAQPSALSGSADGTYTLSVTLPTDEIWRILLTETALSATKPGVKPEDVYITLTAKVSSAQANGAAVSDAASVKLKLYNEPATITVKAQQPDYQIPWNAAGTTTIAFNVKVSPEYASVSSKSIVFTGASGQSIAASELGAGSVTITPNASPTGDYVLSVTVDNAKTSAIIAKFGNITAKAAAETVDLFGKVSSGSDSALVKMAAAAPGSIKVTANPKTYEVKYGSSAKTVVTFDIDASNVILDSNAYALTYTLNGSDVKSQLGTIAVNWSTVSDGKYKLTATIDDAKLTALLNGKSGAELLVTAAVNGKQLDGLTLSGSDTASITLKQLDKGTITVTPKQPEYTVVRNCKDSSLKVVFDVKFDPANLVKKSVGVVYTDGKTGAEISASTLGAGTPAWAVVSQADGKYTVTITFSSLSTKLLKYLKDSGNVVVTVKVGAAQADGSLIYGSGSALLKTTDPEPGSVTVKAKNSSLNIDKSCKPGSNDKTTIEFAVTFTPKTMQLLSKNGIVITFKSASTGAEIKISETDWEFVDTKSEGQYSLKIKYKTKALYDALAKSGDLIMEVKVTAVQSDGTEYSGSDTMKLTLK